MWKTLYQILYDVLGVHEQKTDHRLIWKGSDSPEEHEIRFSPLWSWKHAQHAYENMSELNQDSRVSGTKKTLESHVPGFITQICFFADVWQVTSHPWICFSGCRREVPLKEVSECQIRKHMQIVWLGTWVKLCLWLLHWPQTLATRSLCSSYNTFFIFPGLYFFSFFPLSTYEKSQSSTNHSLVIMTLSSLD